MKFSLPADLKGTQFGYERLGHLALQLEPLAKTEFELDGLSQWCDGHLCAALGAILSLARDRDVNVIIGEKVSSPVKFTWGKNGFWPYIGGVHMTDQYNTALAFEQFSADDEKRFARYISRELLPKELPKMSDPARTQFGSIVQETFNNSIFHAGVTGNQRVFCCGQHYPASSRISFSMADIGVGFRSNVERFMGALYPDCTAIDWALNGGNTTKGRLGGLGLTLLWEWILQNQGRLQIVSHSDFWEGSKRGIERHQLQHSFPGTVVTLHINTWPHISFEDFFAEEDGPLF